MPPLGSDPPANLESPVQTHSYDDSKSKWARLEHLLSEVRNEDSRTKSELERVKMELSLRETELQECREQILRAIDAFQVCDSQILDAFVMIRDSLCNWIEVLPEVNGFEDSWSRIHRTVGRKDQANSLALKGGLEDSLGTAQTEIMEIDIFHIIWRNLFGPVLPGATHDQRRFLKQLLGQIASLKPPKDTYRAFTETDQYQQQLDECSRKTAILVHKYLENFSFSQTVDGEHIILGLIDRVLKPAASLSTKLTCSLEDYSWKWGPTFPRKIQVSDIHKFDFIDCKTHGPAGKANMSAIQNGSKIGHHVSAIFPGLHRQAGTEKIIIKKPLMLVAFKDAPSDPNSIPKTTGPSVPSSKAPQTKQHLARDSILSKLRSS